MKSIVSMAAVLGLVCFGCTAGKSVQKAAPGTQQETAVEQRDEAGGEALEGATVDDEGLDRSEDGAWEDDAADEGAADEELDDSFDGGEGY